MQNPFQDVLELEPIPSPTRQQADKPVDSDEESLDPPFEVHGGLAPGLLVEEQPPLVLMDQNGNNQRNEIVVNSVLADVLAPPLVVDSPIEQQRPLVPMYADDGHSAESDYESESEDDDHDVPLDIQYAQTHIPNTVPTDTHPLISRGGNEMEMNRIAPVGSASNNSSPGRPPLYDLTRFNPMRPRGAGRGLEENSSSPQQQQQNRKRKPSRRIHDQSEFILGWKDVNDMDEFLERLYQYYEGKGFVCIFVLSVTNLLNVAFVVGFAVFLTECIDYSKIPSSNTLQDVIVPNCSSNMRWFTTFLCIIIGSWWSYMIIKTLLYDTPRLLEMKTFVNDILNISEKELQTLLWRDFTDRVVATYSEARLNVPGKKLDAYIIANRIMRRDNYVIALFNKEILDLSLPWLGKRVWLTRMMQDYIIYYGILGYVYDEKGNFKKRFKKESNRLKLAIGMKKRFQKMAMFAVILSPVLFIYLVVQAFFKISEEYRQNPALLGARTYSTLANWKLREYNELSHLFNKRITRSHDNASKYMLQFPNHLVVIVARFISFISGSLAAVLVIITLFDEKFQQGFEITPNRSALFYIGVFGSILALTQGFTQENIVHEPQRWMNEVVLDTHYLPDEWRDQAHLPKVRDEFAELFDHKLILLVYELLSVLLVPLFLYTRLKDNTLAIVDFFREFSVKVDSIGYMCSFAVFDFDKHGDAKFGSRLNPNSERLVSKNGKMEQSFMNFKTNNPEWDPGMKASEFLSKVVSRKAPIGGGIVSSRIMAMSQSELRPSSVMMQGADSLMMSNLQEGEADVVRELIRMLDAVYAGNRNM